MDTQILQSELEKALKRRDEQASVLASTKSIIDASVSLPSLKAIALRRLPKLQQVYTETCKVISELQLALQIGTQPDLLETPAESPTSQPRGRRTVPT